LEHDATQVIVQNGGKVIGSVAHPFATPDLSSFILQAQASKAKIIGLASGPPDNVMRSSSAASSAFSVAASRWPDCWC
jgi:branched-chain amino acid transport system substrate-binding protein